MDFQCQIDVSVTVMPSTDLNLFSFTSFRQYLSELIESERKSGNGTSLRSFAERVGIGLSTLKMVLEGERNLTIKNIHVISESLNLSKSEHDYFEAMVLRDQADDVLVKSYYHSRLKQLKSEAKTRLLRTSDSKIMNKWFFPALLIYLLDVERIDQHSLDDSVLLRTAKKFGIPCKDISEAISELVKAGVLQQKEDSRYHLVFERVNGSLAKQRYIKDVSAEIQKRIGSEFDNPLAMFSAHTLSIPSHLVANFYDEYKKLADRYMSYSAEDPNELEILQVCCQAVPVVKRRPEKQITRIDSRRQKCGL